ncbi:MAG: FHA domain-containing protein [Myxococcales bacterium]|jgi:hypothetical protein|nr:FHA domain-containing protein [Myxococcales bacterium]
MCELADALPWETPESSDSAMERGLFMLSIVRANGGIVTEFPLLQSELLLNSDADGLPEGSPEIDQARVRLCLQAGTLFIEELGGGDGLFRRIRDSEALLLPCELRMGSHRFLLQALEPADHMPLPGFWGAPSVSFRARLIDLLEGGLVGDVFLLRDGSALIGREKGDVVCFPTDSFISGRHAQLLIEGNLAILTDLNSSNGTFVRAQGRRPIFDGDQFLIGSHLLKFALVAKT